MTDQEEINKVLEDLERAKGDLQQMIRNLPKMSLAELEALHEKVKVNP